MEGETKVKKSFFLENGSTDLNERNISVIMRFFWNSDQKNKRLLTMTHHFDWF